MFEGLRRAVHYSKADCIEEAGAGVRFPNEHAKMRSVQIG
jgi:hypothetical protein